MLDAAHMKEYEENGFVCLPGVFSDDEVDALLAETSRLALLDIPQRILESDGELVRSIYAVHSLSDTFGRLVRDVRSLEPARQLLDGDVYIHQTQLNPKAPLRGDAWEWHQDYVFWARDDGMPTSRVLNVAVLLDEVTEFNGPLFVIPGSHRTVLDEDTKTYSNGWENTLTADLRHKVTIGALAELVRQYGMASVKGPRGTVVIFHGRILHSSPPNLSPFPRTVLFTRYNSVDNALRPMANPRPEWLACRDPRPLTPLDRPFLAEGAG